MNGYNNNQGPGTAASTRTTERQEADQTSGGKKTKQTWNNDFPEAETEPTTSDMNDLGADPSRKRKELTHMKNGKTTTTPKKDKAGNNTNSVTTEPDFTRTNQPDTTQDRKSPAHATRKLQIRKLQIRKLQIRKLQIRK